MLLPCITGLVVLKLLSLVIGLLALLDAETEAAEDKAAEFKGSPIERLVRWPCREAPVCSGDII